MQRTRPPLLIFNSTLWLALVVALLLVAFAVIFANPAGGQTCAPADVLTQAEKGSRLTWGEIDANYVIIEDLCAASVAGAQYYFESGFTGNATVTNILAADTPTAIAGTAVLGLNNGFTFLGSGNGAEANGTYGVMHICYNATFDPASNGKVWKFEVQQNASEVPACSWIRDTESTIQDASTCCLVDVADGDALRLRVSNLDDATDLTVLSFSISTL